MLCADRSLLLNCYISLHGLTLFCVQRRQLEVARAIEKQRRREAMEETTGEDRANGKKSRAKAVRCSTFYCILVRVFFCLLSFHFNDWSQKCVET